MKAKGNNNYQIFRESQIRKESRHEDSNVNVLKNEYFAVFLSNFTEATKNKFREFISGTWLKLRENNLLIEFS